VTSLTRRPAVTPEPAYAAGVALPWDAEIDDPVAALALARETYGDTFLVDSGPDRYLFTFSPAGVAAFYALPEAAASKGVADWRMLRRKLPDEVFDGRRTLPHDLFGRDDRIAQLVSVERALDLTVEELGRAGTFDVFAFTRRLGHRVGLSTWGGPGSDRGPNFERLVAAFDVLDGAEAFVHPDAMAAVAASGKAAETFALQVVAEVVGQALESPEGAGDHPLFARIAGQWAGEPDDARRIGVGYDVALLHIASMSNLFAALGWAIVDLLEHPEERDRIIALDSARAEQCVLESTRLAQRSIMSRYVLQPVQFPTGDAILEIEPGVTIATLLPLTNTTAGPGLDRWDPDHWRRLRLADAETLPTPELVTAFGHGRHTCPAQPFSLSAMIAIVTRLFTTFEVTRIDAVRPRPEPAQIGGVARSQDPCRVTYVARHDSSPDVR
jgi:cytochrome P450